MTNTTTPTCDTCTRAVLTKFDCLTSTQLKGAINRQFGILYSVGAISSSLRKLVSAGKATWSFNEKGQRVYWLTDFGKENE